jgi:hypothetical protein
MNGRRSRRFAPAARHLALLAVTYVALAYAIVAAQRSFPPVPATAKEALSVQGVVRAAGAMLGALALALPLTWVFVITRRKKGFSQSIVHTIIILPLAVAGIMTLVQDSLPLAFGLAGIAFLRFRNTLEDTKDAVYLFVATGIGISAASGQLAVGLALSFLFSVTVIVLWWTDFARMPAGLKAKLTLRRLRQTMETRIPGPNRPRPDPLNAALRVHASSVSAAQPAVEAVLNDAAKQWELTGVTPGEHGFSTLDYVVRLRQRTERGALLNDLRNRGTPHVVGAEYR